MSSFGFRENGHNESHTLLKDVNNILPALSTFFVKFSQKFRTGDHQFRENRYSESHIYGHKSISIRTFDIYFSSYMKFGSRDLKIMLLNISEFHKNPRRKAIDLLLL